MPEMKKSSSQSCNLEMRSWAGVGVDPTRFGRRRGRLGGSVSLPQRGKRVYSGVAAI